LNEKGSAMDSFSMKPAEVYEIMVGGSLSPTWSGWFSNLTCNADAEGNTRMVGPVIDQAELYGVLERIRDLGLPLLAVRRLTPPERQSSNSNHKEE
jgi:hypothetical protein